MTFFILFDIGLYLNILTMKRLYPLIFSMLFISIACGNQQKDVHSNGDNDTYANYRDNDDDYYDEEEPNADEADEDEPDYDNERDKKIESKDDESFLTKMFGNHGLKEYDFKDAHTGLVVYTSKYPSDWQVISKPTYTIDQKIPVFLFQIQGPHNLRVFNTPLSVYVAYANPQTYQFMAQNGIPAGLQRPVRNNAQIINDEISGRMDKSGFHYTKTVALPNIENYIKQKIVEGGGTNFNSEITATVWEDSHGRKALALLTRAFIQQPLSFIDTMTLWLYNVEYLFVDDSNFNETIEQYEKSILSAKDNQQWKQYMEQLTQQRMKVAQQRHRMEMQNRQAAFQAHQQKMRGIWAAEDANHAAFMNRSFGAGSDRGQQQFLNTINEQETVYNPLTGNNYQVDAGSTEYWMDSSGNYIKNDDLFYTPNGDINLNNREWVKVDKSF